MSAPCNIPSYLFLLSRFLLFSWEQKFCLQSYSPEVTVWVSYYTLQQFKKLLQCELTTKHDVPKISIITFSVLPVVSTRGKQSSSWER
jgi:hypothetical protein